MIPGPEQCVKRSSIATAVALFQSLAQEPSYAVGKAIKKKKKCHTIDVEMNKFRINYILNLGNIAYHNLIDH